MLSLEINPQFTIHPFLSASNVARMPECKFDDTIAGYNSYRFTTLMTDGRSILVHIRFKENRLYSAQLALSNNAVYGSSWSDWSEEKEVQRARDTQQWLESIGLEARQYEWGTLSSGYDVKSASGYAQLNFID